MAVVDLTDWIRDNHFTRDDAVWCLKRLSANDTLATGAHQAGPYLPKGFLFEIFPEIERPHDSNPDIEFDLYLDSHADHRRARGVWYNHRSRDETRITRLGGASSALLDPDSTGALAVFVFRPPQQEAERECHVWVCDSAPEEDLVEDAVGPVEPGRFRFAGRDTPPLLPGIADELDRGCFLSPDEMPPGWLDEFPEMDALIAEVLKLRPLPGLDPDERLIRRRDCEYELFRSVEEATALPVVRRGFTTMEQFLSFAQSILQRRRVRSGRSLELHARQILEEEQLRVGQDFTHGGESEMGKRPDFLFPSEQCYQDPDYPAHHLRMLAVKTTCRDRWRQVIQEADRIPRKHLLTLQEGVSNNQFRQMQEAGIHLVVPAGLVTQYPRAVRPDLITLESFIGDLRVLRPSASA